MILAVEGMDGVGKTTCAKSLASFLGYEYIATPVQTFFKGGASNPEFKNTMNIMYDMTDSVVKSYFIGLGSWTRTNDIRINSRSQKFRKTFYEHRV